MVVTRRRLVLAFADALSWLVALSMATATRLSFTADSPVDWASLAALAALASMSIVGSSYWFGLSLGRCRVGSLSEATTVVKVWSVTAAMVVTANYLLLDDRIPTLALALSLPIALLMMLGVRLAWRIASERHLQETATLGGRPTIVFGAGDGGELIIRAMLRDPEGSYRPVALIDDDPEKRNRQIQGVEVMGTREDIGTVAAAVGADVLLIAAPSADSVTVADLEAIGRSTGLDVLLLPGTSRLLSMMSVDQIREVTEADLLGRDEVAIDIDAVRAYIAGKRVLVTGAGGSIGSELSRQLHDLSPARLMLLDRDESALHSVQLSIEGRALLDTPDLIIADIRDAERIDEIFAAERPEVVFHAAALKHLTLLENHPSEAVKTNAWGTANLISAAQQFGVERFVNVSTDKAADPTSMLGATKLIAERLTAAAAVSSNQPYVSVRFGNVLGSRGSVLPTFRRQIAKGGPVTVTHPDVTRFFMTIPEAVRLVLQSGGIGRPGEILVLDMGEPVRIVDMAERLIRRIDPAVSIEFTGLRPAEKLHEVVMAEAEVGTSREHPRVLHTVSVLGMPSFDQLDPSRQELLAECCQSLEGWLDVAAGRTVA